MIVLENPLLQDTLEDGSDSEVEDMEVTGALKEGKTTELALKKSQHINNVAKLKERLTSLQKKLPWLETLDVTVDLKTSAEEMKSIVNDNFKQEMLFYKQAQTATQQALPRLRSMGVDTLRPEDYFAEMVKSDDHMRKVKEKLVSKQLTLERTEKVSKMRKMKKLGKKVQQEVLKKRADEKKAMLESVKKVRKGKEAAASLMDDDDAFVINVKADHDAGNKGGINKKRKAKDAKYGSGGKKKAARKNTEESYKDTSSFSSRIHSKPKRSAKNEKRVPTRPGKNKRTSIRNKKNNKK